MTSQAASRPGLSRRALLHAAGLLALGLTAPGVVACRTAGARRVVVGTRTRIVDGRDDQTWLAVLDVASGEAFQIPVPMRGHSVIQHPTNADLVYVLPHRTQFRASHELPLPGTDAAEVSLSERRVLRVLRADEGRHFYGHGNFSPAGDVLYTTENDFGGDGNGVVSVRDAATLRPLGDFPTFGVDPHEMHLRDNGALAIIANGGERTHPDYPSIVLNPDEYDSSLTWVDVASGRMLDQVRLDGVRYSQRHFAVDDDASVIVALQDGVETDGDLMPVAVRYRGGGLRALAGPPGMAERTARHALSAALLSEHGLGICTHPKGGLVTVWSLETGELAAGLEIPSPTGVAVAPDARSFLVSSANGSVYRVDSRRLTAAEFIPSPDVGVEWDSHLTNVRNA
jgi:hypothetical protein